MRNRGRARRAGRRLTGLAGSQNGHLIVSITEGDPITGETSEYLTTTLAGHGLQPGQSITISGVGVGFDGSRSVQAIYSVTLFSYGAPNLAGSATGGRWD